ncbi:MAG: hypothetical protein FWF41_07475 [Betaproteobacteria bacterium]|nr:hypothetical protein [Betaproteobacteria bacterium]
MKWMNWLRDELLSDSATSDLTASNKNSHDFNIKQVLDLHKTWTTCLEDLVRLQVDRTLDFPEKSKTPPFLLQRWLLGPAHRRYGNLFEYRALSKAHEKFHACSDAILHCNQCGLQDHARQILEDELPVYSENVQTSIVRLYAAAAKKH